MRILEENNYILECWKCDTKIIYTYKNCDFDSRYHSYELRCPNCHNIYSSTRNELFGKKYKENECKSDEKDLQKRINKAIKIINDWDEEKTTYIESYYFKEDLLEILKGNDK